MRCGVRQPLGSLSPFPYLIENWDRIVAVFHVTIQAIQDKWAALVDNIRSGFEWAKAMLGFESSEKGPTATPDTDTKGDGGLKIEIRKPSDTSYWDKVKDAWTGEGEGMGGRRRRR